MPVSPRAWRSWRDIADIFDGPADPQWASDRNGLDDDLRDPWETAR